MTRVTFVAACSVAAMVLLTGGPSPARRLEGRGRPDPLKPATAWLGALATLLAVMAVVMAAGLPAVPASVGLGVAGVLIRRRRGARRHREQRTQERDDVQALRALAAELRSGLPPAEALRIAAGITGATGVRERMLAAAGVAAVGGDTAAALAIDASPGSAQAGLAAAWSVCQSTGARLAAPITRLAASATGSQRLNRESDAAFAGARASARLLAALPLAGAALGALSGTGALHVLVATGPGQACLVLGSALDLLGLAWLDRIAAEPS